MYSIVFSDGFVASVKKLDKRAKLRIDENLKILENDPFHAKLHTKPLHGNLGDFYSLRAGRDYRVIFKFLDNKTILLLRAAHRSKVYK